jgi:hypothetical protein
MKEYTAGLSLEGDREKAGLPKDLKSMVYHRIMF